MRNPGTAAVLSFLVPGFGQIYRDVLGVRDAFTGKKQWRSEDKFVALSEMDVAEGRLSRGVSYVTLGFGVPSFEISGQ